MKLNKEFVDILVDSRFNDFHKIVEKMNFLVIEHNNIKNLHLQFNKFEEILYTVDFLERNKLVTIERRPNYGRNIDFDPSNIPIDDFVYFRLTYINNKINNYWNMILEIDSSIYDFISNGYKTDKQLQDRWNRYLPILIAIIAPLLTILLTKIIDKLFPSTPVQVHLFTYLNKLIALL